MQLPGLSHERLALLAIRQFLSLLSCGFRLLTPFFLDGLIANHGSLPDVLSRGVEGKFSSFMIGHPSGTGQYRGGKFSCEHGTFGNLKLHRPNPAATRRYSSLAQTLLAGRGINSATGLCWLFYRWKASALARRAADLGTDLFWLRPFHTMQSYRAVAVSSSSAIGFPIKGRAMREDWRRVLGVSTARSTVPLGQEGGRNRRDRAGRRAGLQRPDLINRNFSRSFLRHF